MDIGWPPEPCKIHADVSNVEFADFQFFMVHGSTKYVIYCLVFKDMQSYHFIVNTWLLNNAFVAHPKYKIYITEIKTDLKEYKETYSAYHFFMTLP